MTQIKVYYDSETHEPNRVHVVNDNVFTGDDKATFNIEGSSAVLRDSDCSGEFLSEAFDHVEQLGFVQAVTMEGQDEP